MATDTDTEPMMQASTTFAQSSNSTRQVLNRFDLDGDGIISPSEANLMANANVSEQTEKKSKYLAQQQCQRCIVSLYQTMLLCTHSTLSNFFSTSMLGSPHLIEYKQIAGISFTLLVLALVANFGLTIAT